MANSKPRVSRGIRRNVRSITGRVLDFAIGIESSRQDPFRPTDDGLMMSYQAAYWSTLAVGMRGIRVDGNHAFMDFGCGKGRVLYLASWYKFGQIIGVELNPSMALIARRNVAKARGRSRIRSVEVIEQDARTVTLPANLRVAFLFNPFIGEVFWTVASRLKENADLSGTPMRMIYANPVEGDMLRRLGFAPAHESQHCTVFDYPGL